MRARNSHGFSLVEALVATTILTAALGTLGQLTLASARAVGTSRTITVAVLAARQKLEQLCALPHAHPGLAPSPAGALHNDLAGYSEHLDATGAMAHDSSHAAFIRRWSIEPLPDTTDGAVVLQVRVIPLTAHAGPGSGARFAVVKSEQLP